MSLEIPDLSCSVGRGRGPNLPYRGDVVDVVDVQYAVQITAFR